MKNKFAITLSILLQTIAQAAPMGNGPYSPIESPTPVPLQKLEFSKQSQESGFYSSVDTQDEIRPHPAGAVLLAGKAGMNFSEKSAASYYQLSFFSYSAHGKNG